MIKMRIFNPTNKYKEKSNESNETKKFENVIVGGGPSGLATAIMLARRGYKDIHVYEKLDVPPPPDSEEWGDINRSYMLGIGGRGQCALNKMELLDKIKKYCMTVNGRMSWNANQIEPKISEFSDRKYKACTLARDRLVACLLEEISEKYAEQISLNYNFDCTDIKWQLEKSPKVQLTITSTKNPPAKISSHKIETNFVVGADGVKSSVRLSMEENPELVESLSGKPMKVFKFENKNERIYKTIPLRVPKDWRVDLNYQAQSKMGVNFEALPSVEGHMVGLILYRPENDDINNIKTIYQARRFFKKAFPGLERFFTDEDLKGFVKRPPSSLPSFSYCGPVLHMGPHAVLLGDTIKTIKPYFGLGVNSAFEDVMILNDCLEECNDDLAEALPLFTKKRASSVKALVDLSRGFDTTGWKQALFFVGPIIVDGFFRKLFPQIFKPNTIVMLQMPEEGSFAQVRRRKWLDRVMQVSMICALGQGVFSLAKAIFRRSIMTLFFV